ncbi:MAG: Gfo/Idh/MocA family oxidoreductase [Oscillospiraceae bacterium]
MNVLIVGLGSMGKRRMRLIKQNYPEYNLFGFDTNDERSKDVSDMFGAKIFRDINDAIEQVQFNCGFVCTAPLAHNEIIKILLKSNINVFTELNLVSDGYAELINIKKESLLFLSSTLIYRNDLQFICDKVNGNKVNYIYHSGQYLPDWHPWENYNDFFVGDKRTNGCREIFAIELPWMTKCFGQVKNFTVIKDKATSLKLDYYDNFILMLEHENGTKGLFAVDIISRKAMRKLEIFSENIHLFWDGTPDSLKSYNTTNKKLETIEVYSDIEKDSHYCDNIVENAYLDEIRAFFHAVETGDCSKIRYSFKDDIDILKLISDFGA